MQIKISDENEDTIVNSYLPLLMLIDFLSTGTGLVLLILKGINVLNIPWFWAAFPLWIVNALFILTLILDVIFTYTIAERKKHKHNC